MRRRLIFFAPLALLGVAFFIFAGGTVVQMLWNWLLPPLFGWPVVTFWQALGLLALCRILFGGFGSHGGSRPSIRRRMAEKMGERMTDGDRDRFRQRMRERFGFDPGGRMEL
jgi:hypothetical protein